MDYVISSHGFCRDTWNFGREIESVSSADIKSICSSDINNIESPKMYLPLTNFDVPVDTEQLID